MAPRAASAGSRWHYASLHSPAALRARAALRHHRQVTEQLEVHQCTQPLAFKPSYMLRLLPNTVLTGPASLQIAALVVHGAKIHDAQPNRCRR